MNRGSMDLHLLEILLAFKKYGTLSSTAEALHISQPTLTRNMQTLEEEVDVPVFIHGKNTLKLNETGEFLVKESEKLYETEKAYCFLTVRLNLREPITKKLQADMNILRTQP